VRDEHSESDAGPGSIPDIARSNPVDGVGIAPFQRKVIGGFAGLSVFTVNPSMALLSIVIIDGLLSVDQDGQNPASYAVRFG
jgi:hypothetical protein